MALNPTDPNATFFDDWFAAMQGGQAAPMQVTAPEYGSMPSLEPGMPAPPPPPPPPPPQRIGPSPIEMPPSGEIVPTPPMPEIPSFPDSFDADWAQAQGQEPAVKIGQPRPVPGAMSVDEAASVGAPSPLHPGLGIPANVIGNVGQALAPRPVDPYAPAPIDPYGVDPDAADEIEMSPEYHSNAELDADQQIDLGRRDPGALMRYYANKEGAAAEKYAAKQYDLARENHERAKAAHDRRIAADRYADQQAAQVEADAREVAKKKIDPEKWWADRSAPQKIAGFLSAIIGGLYQARRGGPNLGIEMIDKAIEQDIAAQSANLSNERAEINRRQGLVADLYARSGDREQAENTARIVMYEVAADEAKAEAMKYAAGGVRHQRAAAAVLAFEEKRAAALAAEKERNFKLKMDLDERDRKWTETMATVEKSRAEARKLNAAGRGGGGGQKYPAEYLEQTFGVKPPPGVASMSLKDYMPLLNASDKAGQIRRGKSEEIIKGTEARLAQSGAGGSPYAIGDQEGNPYTTIVDGKEQIFEIKDDKRRARVEEVNKAAQNVRRMADLVKILRAKGGGASKIMGTPEYDELVALAAATDFETYVGFGLGAPSSGDKAMAENARGGRDITSFIYDPSAGFEAYATNLESKLNTEFYGAGRKGPPIKFKRVEAAQAEERTQFQNLDVYDAPEIYQAKDPEIRKRAAKRAAESVPALARQSNIDMLARMAKANEERMREGLIDKATAYGVQKELRKQYLRRHNEGGLADQVQKGGRDRFGRHVGELAITKRGDPSEAEIDRAMGVNLEGGD